MKNKLKEIRTAAGLTQSELGEKIGVCKQYISGWENGQRKLENARASTLTAICNALGCEQNDLFVKSEFEFEDGKLVVDGLYYDPRYVNGYIVKIGDDMYSLPHGDCDNKPIEKRLSPVFRKLSSQAMEKPQYVYIFYNLIPRGGFVIEIGRAITVEEFDELKKQYNLTDDDISNEFVDKIGSIYGKYAKTYTAVQIRVDDGKAIALEQQLNDKGIEAGNISAGRINIRVR